MTRSEVFDTKYRIDESGCWIWLASTTGASGYGRFWDGKKLVLAHRFAYERDAGPVPHGRDLDHLCRVRLCCNPKHLEPVTRRENVVRGVSPNAANAAKTHCIRGHELTQENCYATKWPYNRECKACARILSREKYAAKLQTNNLSSAERNASALRKAIEEVG